MDNREPLKVVFDGAVGAQSAGIKRGIAAVWYIDSSGKKHGPYKNLTAAARCHGVNARAADSAFRHGYAMKDGSRFVGTSVRREYWWMKDGDCQCHGPYETLAAISKATNYPSSTINKLTTAGRPSRAGVWFRAVEVREITVKHVTRPTRVPVTVIVPSAPIDHLTGMEARIAGILAVSPSKISGVSKQIAEVSQSVVGHLMRRMLAEGKVRKTGVMFHI